VNFTPFGHERLNKWLIVGLILAFAVMVAVMLHECATQATTGVLP
jgi:hypothetical protein